MRSILGKCDETVVTEINKADDQAAMGQTIATDTLTAIASESASPLQTGDQRPRLTLKRRVVAGNVAATGTVDSGTVPGPANANVATPLRRLTGGRRELTIAHAGETYVLRVTKANKLILTKASAAGQESPA